MSCSNTIATDENRQELSSGTTYIAREFMRIQATLSKPVDWLTLCTSTPPSVSTKSGPPGGLAGCDTCKASANADECDWTADEGSGAFGRDGRTGAAALLVDVVEDFCVTIIWSPFLSPRLSTGSSGMMVRGRGGYPDFTVHDT